MKNSEKVGYRKGGKKNRTHLQSGFKKAIVTVTRFVGGVKKVSSHSVVIAKSSVKV